MISEVTFSTKRASLWQALAPNSERFIRRINMNLNRFGVPILGGVEASRRGYLNEVAFHLAKQAYPDLGAAVYDDVSWSAVNEARGRLEKFEDIKPDDLREPTAEEWQEIFRVARSFSRFVADQSAGSLLVKFAPTSRGCGLLDACAGDILIGNKLFEVKAGDRPYRSSDLRQLLTYCSLNSVDHSHEIKSVGCVNPRHGTYFCIEVDLLALELSSKSATELFAEIIYLLSGGDIST